MASAALVAPGRVAAGPVPWRRVWAVLRPDRFKLVVLVTLTGLASVSAVLPAFITVRIVDDGISRGDARTVSMWGAAGVGVAAGLAGLRYAQQWLANRISLDQLCRMRRAAFEKIMRLPLGYLERTPTGETISRTVTDPVEAQQLAGQVLPQMVGVVVSFLSIGSAMVTISWQVTVAALVLAPAVLVPAALVGRRLQSLNHQQMANAGDVITVIEERASAPGARLCRLYSTPEAQLRVFDRENEISRDLGLALFRSAGVYSAALGLLGAVAVVMVYWMGGLQALEHRTSVGEVVAMSVLVTQLYAPITALAGVRMDLIACSASFQRHLAFLDEPEELSDAPTTRAITVPEPGLARRGIPAPPAMVVVDHLSVPGDAGDRLHEVSFELSPGGRLALVGPSGAGKSSLLDVLAGVLEPSQGSVWVAGEPLSAVRGAAPRRIGLLAQDCHFFHESVADNLRIAAPSATDEDLERACRQANVWETVQGLPQGLDTSMGDHGGRLSGGERQRLAMARILLLDPSVILLDEPTAHLDPEAADYFLKTLQSALRGRTVIMSTHRLDAVQDFDQILVVSDGRIVARGDHLTLLRRDGWYAQQVRAGQVPEGTRAAR